MNDGHDFEQDRQGHSESPMFVLQDKEHNWADSSEGSEPAEERESPIFVPQDDEHDRTDISEEPERATSSPVMQDPADQESPDINQNEVVNLDPLVEANNAMNQEGAAEVDDGDREQEQVEEETDANQGDDRDDDPSENGAGEGDSDQNDTGQGGPNQRPLGVHKANHRRVQLLQKRVDKLEHLIDLKNETIKAQKEAINHYEKQLRANGGARSSAPTWPGLLRIAIATGKDYEKAWKQSQRELNMPVKRATTHPNIRLVEKIAEPLDDNSRQSSPAIPDAPLPGQTNLRNSFDKLPREVLFKILEELLWFDGSLIHCFSRLDPYNAPDHFPSAQELGDHRTGIRGRFFISEEKRVAMSLTHDTVDPNKILAPLSVCRRWAWYGIHLFYGRNTFAFSSLGEWDRFCNGIKLARVKRLQNVELTWVGGKCLAFDTSDTRGKRMNMRTLPLTWFCETSNLKSLVIHITEASKDYIRRRHETPEYKLLMRGKTTGQPNARMTRALRCCQGMDYIYQLRGLYWLRVYDLEKTVSTMERQFVRDSSFVIDLERVVTQEKVPSRAVKSLMPNLERLFPEGRWQPVHLDFKLVEKIFSENNGWDLRENDLDRDATSSRCTLSPSPAPEGSDDEEPDDSFDDSSSDSPGPGLPTPPASTGRRMRRYDTPVAAQMYILDSEEDAENQNEEDGEEDQEDEASDQDVEDDQSLDHDDDDASEQGSGSEGDESDGDDARSINTDAVRTLRCHQYVHQHRANQPADDEDAD